VDQLDLTLESWARQELMPFELIVVDCDPGEDTRATVERFGPRLPIRSLRHPHMTRGAARNTGLRAAEGDVILFADDGRVVAADHVRRLSQLADGEVAVGFRLGLLSMWEPHLPGATVRRVLDPLRARPQLGALLDHRPRKFFQAADLSARFDELTSAFGVADPLWDRLAPVVQATSGELRDFPLPWLFGLCGHLAVDRRLAFAAGPWAEPHVAWDYDDVEYAWRLARADGRFRVREDLTGWQQQRNHLTWPHCGSLIADELARKGDPLDAWLLWRFLTGDDPLLLAELQRARRAAPAGSPVVAQLESATRELVPLASEGYDVWCLRERRH
jgi:glycosyltransferase involved in cell wall biosynthesis